jgi:hypothetical protein
MLKEGERCEGSDIASATILELAFLHTHGLGGVELELQFQTYS